MPAANLNSLLSIFLQQVQELEDAILAVMKSRSLGFATGTALNFLGRMAGEDRLGRFDDAYREGIRLRIFINASSGRPEELIYVARVVSGLPSFYIDISAGNFSMLIPGWTGDDGTLLATMNKMRPAGTRLLDILTVPYAPRRMGDRMNDRFMHA